MADQSRGGVKYIIWGVIGIIAILVTVKQLGFIPTKITTPAVSVELTGGLAPPKDSNQNSPPPVQNASQLETRVRELESQLASAAPRTAPPISAATGESPTPRYPQGDQPVNIAGTWRADPMVMTVTQFGGSVLTQVSVYGVLSSVGQGTLTGRNLSVSYMNSLYMQGTLQATVSADGKRLDVVDYGRGYPQQIVFYRSQ